MVKEKNINFIIDAGTYPFDVMVSINQTDKQLGESLDLYGPLPVKEIESCRYTPGVGKARFVMFSMGASVIRFKHLPETPEDYGHLAHEIFHISACILDRVGMK